MRKKFGCVIGIATLFAASFGIACKTTDSTSHSHTVYAQWKSDENAHFQVCADCEERVNQAPHEGGVATCTSQAICDVCARFYGEYANHAYTQIEKDETHHWNTCACGALADEEKALHSGGNATCQTKAVCEVCHVEYGDYAAHTYTEVGRDENYHWKECSCGAVDETSLQLHDGGNATCEEKATCADCGRAYGTYAPHDYTEKKGDEYYHWTECVCGEVSPSGTSLHVGGEATCLSAAKCDFCKLEYGSLGTHSGGTATCTQLAVCLHCSNPYGATKNHQYTIENHDERYAWLECICGAIDEYSKVEIEIEPPPTEPTEPDTGEGETDDTDGGTEEPPPTEPTEPTEPDTGEGETDDTDGGTEELPTEPTEPDTGEGETGDADGGTEELPTEPTEPTEPDTGEGETDDTDGGTEELPTEPTEPTEPDTGEGETGDTDGGTEEPPPTAPLLGGGTEWDPYVLTQGQTVNLQITDNTACIYFQYTATMDGLVHFTATNNVDVSYIQYSDGYDMQYVAPTNISVTGGVVYTFLLYPSNAGEMSFTFTVS